MKQMFLLAVSLTAAFVAPQAADAASVVDGKAIYEIKCEVCHGTGGVPAIPEAPAFSKGERMEKPDEFLKNSVKRGIKTMPAWGEALTDKEIDNVVAFIRTLKK